MASVKGGNKANSFITSTIDKMRGLKLNVGFLGNTTYPDGRSVPENAAIHEFGSPERNIPPRPYFRNMVIKNKSGWGPKVAESYQSNGHDLKKSYQDLGETMRDQLKQSIIATNSPPLSPRTIRAKGFDKPLIDTGLMIDSVEWEIEDDE